MSGTSADAVDAALVKFEQNAIELVGFTDHALPEPLKQRLIALNTHPHLSLEALSQLSFDVAQQFIASARTLLQQTGLNANDITAIGSHGQTIYHAPHIPMSLQIGHPALIAKTLGIATVADFRVDDMALGGQGAPFAPAFHQPLFAATLTAQRSLTPTRSPTNQSNPTSEDCFVVNIGGIANISFLPANGAVRGFDTGPGNALLDEVCQQHFKQPYDANGVLAAQGQVHTTLLNALLAHPYFSQSAPKSTGRDVFNQAWLTRTLNDLALQHLSAHDLLCTLTELTAQSIAQSIAHNTFTAVWVCGGGAFNGYLLQRLQHHLPNAQVQSAQARHINPHAIEAMMCAWLAKQRIDGQAVALSNVTGAQRDAILRGLWLP
jgi:anhydro-N-acetylmuramic acid kinase